MRRAHDEDLLVYPHPYPQSRRNPPELAGAHRNNRTQPEPTGGLPRFRYAVPVSSSPDSGHGRGLLVRLYLVRTLKPGGTLTDRAPHIVGDLLAYIQGSDVEVSGPRLTLWRFSA